MSIRLRNGRAGVLALVGGTLCTLVATAPAQAVCVGDCNNVCEVVISNLILGVNIALGLQPVSACEAFANQNGEVNIAQLVRGVGNAQNGCNPADCATITDTPTEAPTDTPTEPPTVTPTETPTEGPTLTPTVTGTPTPFEPICNLKAGVCVGGDNDGQDCTANAQCTPGGGMCNFDRKCVGGANAGASCTTDAGCKICVGGEKAGMPCTNDAGCPGGTCPAGGTCPTLGDISKIELNVAALPIPLAFALSGQISLVRGPITNNDAELACTIVSIAPVNIPAIGFVCITPPDDPCPGSAGTIDCDGGSELGINLLSDGNIGECLGNAACETLCVPYCEGIGSARQTSSCTGYCSAAGSTKACNTDDDCLPKCSVQTCAGGGNDGEACTDGTQCPRVCVGGANMGMECTENAGCPGSTCGGATCAFKTCAADADCTGGGTCGQGDGACNGPDPVGSSADICQCQCVDAMAGGASAAGAFQCQLGSSLVVEDAAPCDGTDVGIAVGDACIPVTTSSAESQIINANFSTATLPSTGPAINNGTSVPCANYETGPYTGIKGLGAVNFFGSALGDIVVELFAVCK